MKRFKSILFSGAAYHPEYMASPMRRGGWVSCLTVLLLSVVLPVQAQLLSDTIDVVHYDIHLDILNMPAKSINGATGVNFTVKQSQVEALTLELKQLQVDSVKSASGDQLGFQHTGTRLNITLPLTMTPADTSTVWVYYHGVPFAEGWGGFHFFGNYAFNLGVGFESIPHNLGKAWFPCVDDFVDRALYDYYIRVEMNNTAVCGGLLQSVTNNGDGTQTFHWKGSHTIPTYLASVVAGSYILKPDTFNGMDADIPVTYYVRPADTAKVAGTFANMKDIAAAFEERFGAYPFSRIGITGTALGAMEHAENIAYPHGSINGSTAGEWLYAHELSHMWFGDKVTCASAADMWLNEGWARWCEIIFTEALYGQEAADTYFKILHYNVLRYARTNGDGFFALVPMPEEYTYGSTVYDKGGMVTHTLRYYMGDSLFFPAVRDYLEQYAYDDAYSWQLRDALSASSGIDLEGFFDQFVYGPGFTHYSVDSFKIVTQKPPAFNHDRAPVNYEVTVYMRQKLWEAQVYGEDCRTQLTFVDGNRNMETHMVEFSGATDSVTLTVGLEPLLVLTDINHRVADATTDELKTIRTTGVHDFENTFFKLDVKQIADSALVSVTHNWVAPDSLWVPQTGLTLSSTHYWTIEGIFPEGFSAQGVFSYNKSILDWDILVNSGDSLVLLYRPGTGYNWQPVAFTKNGIFNLGTLRVDELRAGQYVFAIWDEAYVDVHQLPVEERKGLLIIYPNPSDGHITIHTKAKSESRLDIHTIEGKLVYSRKVEQGEKVKWSGRPGHYCLSLIQANRLIAAAKAVLK